MSEFAVKEGLEIAKLIAERDWERRMDALRRREPEPPLLPENFFDVGYY